jgi:hypothetical protein
MTRAVFAAGLPAPEVFDEVTLDGRFGIVLSRLDGPTLLQLLRTRAMTPEQAGAILAALSISVHKTPPPRHGTARPRGEALEQGNDARGEVLRGQSSAASSVVTQAIPPVGARRRTC